MSTNPIVHWELIGPDGDALKSFYTSIFDWQLAAPEGFDGYYMTDGDAVGLGGAVGQGNEEMPAYGAIYVQVESIEESLGKVEANGGTTLVPRTEIPDMVIYALFKDPAGNVVGLVEGNGS